MFPTVLWLNPLLDMFLYLFKSRIQDEHPLKIHCGTSGSGAYIISVEQIQWIHMDP